MRLPPNVRSLVAYGAVALVAVFLGKDFLFSLVDAINAIAGAR